MDSKDTIPIYAPVPVLKESYSPILSYNNGYQEDEHSDESESEVMYLLAPVQQSFWTSGRILHESQFLRIQGHFSMN